jgi:hypothetical protein
MMGNATRGDDVTLSDPLTPSERVTLSLSKRDRGARSPLAITLRQAQGDIVAGQGDVVQAPGDMVADGDA